MTATENETLRDVLAETVEIRGSCSFRMMPLRHVISNGMFYRNVGGYALGFIRSDSDVGRIELRENGLDNLCHVADFNYYDEAYSEFLRLAEQLELRDRVIKMSALTDGDILPAKFLRAVRSGDAETLLVAADYQEEEGEGDRALLLRAAYYQLKGETNVAVKSGKKTTVIYNAQHVTPRYKGGNLLNAVVVTPGESVRVVSACDRYIPGEGNKSYHVRVVESKEFKVGDQAEYDSYNLSYFGPIHSITAKTVTIGDKYGRSSKRRLSIGSFASKNHDFDLAKARKRNAEHMD
jgi:hypothetical protein